MTGALLLLLRCLWDALVPLLGGAVYLAPTFEAPPVLPAQGAVLDPATSLPREPCSCVARPSESKLPILLGGCVGGLLVLIWERRGAARAVLRPTPKAFAPPAAEADALAQPQPSTPAKPLGELERFVRQNGSVLVQPGSSWTRACGTDRGPVRQENQDEGLAIGLRCGDQELDVAIVADGLGGLPLGAEAARLAVRAAARTVVEHLAATAALEAVALEAIEAAQAELGRYAEANGLQARDGLRSTLAVVVADAREYGWAHVGDGGGLVLRQEGCLDSFLVPQKGAAPNVVSASLGPVPEGVARHGALARRPGDLLFLGTDGIFDRVDDSFAPAVRNLARELGGDLDRVVRAVLEDFGAHRDAAGFPVCDDNMTLALIAGGRPC
jgi:protein phosphatase